MLRNISLNWLGRREYCETWQLQKDYSSRAQAHQEAFLIGVEHPLVITQGRRLKQQEPTIPFASSIPIVQTDRGGMATIHNPGQLVIYPIVPLRALDFGVREWVEFLLTVTQQTLLKCNIIIIHKNNGLFTKNGKIASLGIAIHKGISTHGLAINVSNDLDVFSLISACGVTNQPMDRVCDTQVDMDVHALFLLWCETFSKMLKNRHDLHSTVQTLKQPKTQLLNDLTGAY
jgi:lipoyl(octanoyl) transferase